MKLVGAGLYLSDDIVDYTLQILEDVMHAHPQRPYALDG